MQRIRLKLCTCRGSAGLHGPNRHGSQPAKIRQFGGSRVSGSQCEFRVYAAVDSARPEATAAAKDVAFAGAPLPEPEAEGASSPRGLFLLPWLIGTRGNLNDRWT